MREAIPLHIESLRGRSPLVLSVLSQACCLPSTRRRFGFVSCVGRALAVPASDCPLA